MVAPSVTEKAPKKTFAELWTDMNEHERSILKLRCKGKTVVQISEEIFLQPSTVRNLLNLLLHKSSDAIQIEGPNKAEVLCWYLGYETALERIQRQIAQRKRERSCNK